jgi:hypothetical protein
VLPSTGMTEQQVTLSFDPELAAAVQRAAERDGLSVVEWLTRLARDASVDREAEDAHQYEEGVAALREVEAELGGFTEEGKAWASRVLDELGVTGRKR